MKPIVEYLLGKRKNKISDYNYYIVWPMSNVQKYFESTYPNNELDVPNTDYRWWLLSSSQILNAIKKIDKDDIQIMKIPDGYDHTTIQDHLRKKKYWHGELESVFNINELNENNS